MAKKENPVARAVGENIKRIREKSGFNQAKFAESIGLKQQSSLSNIEKGKVLPSPETVERIKKRWGAKHDDIYGSHGINKQLPSGQSTGVSLDAYTELAAKYGELRKENDLLHRKIDYYQGMVEAEEVLANTKLNYYLARAIKIHVSNLEMQGKREFDWSVALAAFGLDFDKLTDDFRQQLKEHAKRGFDEI